MLSSQIITLTHRAKDRHHYQYSAQLCNCLGEIVLNNSEESAITAFPPTNTPHHICLAVFEYLMFGDGQDLRDKFASGSTLYKFDIPAEIIASLIQVGEDEESAVVRAFRQQSEVFLNLLRTMALLYDSEEVTPLYSPKSREPCLCKIGNAIIRDRAPYFYRTPRNLYEYFSNRYIHTEDGLQTRQKSTSLTFMTKQEQFRKLLARYNVIARVEDHDL